MTKANTRRRIVSVLLALVMLVSLMPSLVVPAHAFWDDYDTGGDYDGGGDYTGGDETGGDDGFSDDSGASSEEQ